jgi:release factor glutamine methyltransferase
MNTFATISDAVRSAALDLAAHSESPRLDAELLLGRLLGMSRAGLIAHGSDPVTTDCERAYADLVSRRARGAPLAYLTGSREFWSLDMKVTPAVLVPRPETELVVERALELANAEEHCKVLDLGTGSGAIALAIASARPHWSITAVDISPPALEVAIENSARLKLAHIDWRVGSWFEAVPGKRFDLIVANPPYIAAADPALAELSAEPALALCAGPTGLEALTAIAASAPPYLQENGWLVLEHAAAQAGEVARLLKSHGFSSIRVYSDFSGKPRVTLGTFHTQH